MSGQGAPEPPASPEQLQEFQAGNVEQPAPVLEVNVATQNSGESPIILHHIGPSRPLQELFIVEVPPPVELLHLLENAPIPNPVFLMEPDPENQENHPGLWVRLQNPWNFLRRAYLRGRAPGRRGRRGRGSRSQCYRFRL